MFEKFSKNYNITVDSPIIFLTIHFIYFENDSNIIIDYIIEV